MANFLSWILQIALLVGLIASGLFYLFSLYAFRRFFRLEAPPTPVPDAELPGVTVLKPLKGCDQHLYANLASLCSQDYPRFQIVCGVADAEDPAIDVVRRLQRAYPRVDVDLVVDAAVFGTNYKVSNLHNMMRAARHDIIAIADSDIRVRPGHLRGLAAHLRDEQVGLVTCLYRAVSAGRLPALTESLFINSDFCTNVLVARLIETPRYAFGATIALRRRVLEQMGGFLPLANYLADDYQIGHRVAELGYRLALSRELVDTVITVSTWRDLFRHQLRWARTYRICRPVGYFTSVLVHGTLWSLVALLAHGITPASAAAAATVLGLRYLSMLALYRRYLDIKVGGLELVWLPLKDLFSSLVWFFAFTGDTVWWSGRRFRVLRTGEMIDLTPPGAEDVADLGVRA